MADQPHGVGDTTIFSLWHLERDSIIGTWERKQAALAEVQAALHPHGGGPFTHTPSSEAEADALADSGC
jgi:hypothetical protein